MITTYNALPCQYLHNSGATVPSIYWNTAARAATRKGVSMATEQMFCFQCEQVAKCELHRQRRVCGKPADVADAQDALTGAMIALARTAREAGVKNDRICDLIVGRPVHLHDQRELRRAGRDRA